MKRFKAILTVLWILATSFSYSQEKNMELALNGTCLLEQVGSCRMLSEPFDVKLEITINEDSWALTAKEFWKNDEGVFEEKINRKWTGQRINKQAFRFKLEVEFTCGSEVRTETLHFIGVVNCQDDNCEMKIDDTFAMCPSSNCIFRITYNLKG